MGSIYAEKVLGGEIFIHHAIGPVYIIVLALAGIVIKNYFYAGLVIGLISAVFVIYFTFRTIELIFSRETALIVTLLLAVNTIFDQYTYSNGTDMLFSAFASLAVFYFLKQTKISWGKFAVAAVLSALVYLTRYNGVFIIAGIAVSLLAFNLVSQIFTKRVLLSAFTIIIFFLTITPWGIYCLKEKGDFFYNKNYQNIVYAVYGEGKVSWEDKEQLYEKFDSISDVVFTNPDLFFKEIGKNIYEHLLEDMNRLVGWQLGILVLPGILLIFFKKKTPAQYSYYLINMMFFGILLVVFYNPRFSMFLIPFYVVLALNTVYFLRDLLRKPFGELKWFVPVISLILIGWTFIESYDYNKDNISSGPEEILAISDWFNKNIDNVADSTIIVARKPQIAYYLNMQFKWFPNVTNYPDLIKELRKLNAQYLYFSGIEAGLRREFQFLLNYKNAPPELKPIVFIAYPPAVLYKIQPEQNEQSVK